MSRGMSPYKPSDLTKILRGVLKAGLPVVRVEFLPDKITVFAGHQQDADERETSEDLRKLL
jgi:hypothetical protein